MTTVTRRERVIEALEELQNQHGQLSPELVVDAAQQPVLVTLGVDPRRGPGINNAGKKRRLQDKLLRHREHP